MESEAKLTGSHLTELKSKGKAVTWNISKKKKRRKTTTILQGQAPPNTKSEEMDYVESII